MKTVSQMGRTERRITHMHLNQLLDSDPNLAVREAHSTLSSDFSDLFARHLTTMGRNQAYRRTLKELLKRPKVVQIDSLRSRRLLPKAA